MSRMLILGILGVLVVLLAVMVNLITPKAPEPPKQPSNAQRDMITKNEKLERETMMKKKQEMIKKMASQRAPTAATTSKEKLPHPPPKPSPGSMQITSKWFHDRQPGENGIKSLDEEQKAVQNAPKADQPKLELPTRPETSAPK